MRFHQVIIDHEHQLVETVFSDGSSCPASPHDTNEYRQHAQSKGCGDDIWRYCVEHDLAHVMLAELIGKPSPVLWAVAHGLDATAPIHEMDERASQALHAFCNVAGWPVEYDLIRASAHVKEIRDGRQD